MRIKLTLKPNSREEMLPINYQYPLSAAIYKILASASPEYAEFLHKEGYLGSDHRPIKLFTFSRLFLPGVKRFKSSLVINHAAPCTLFISSPMLDDFIQNLVLGLFEQQQLTIGGPNSVGRFTITHVETLAMPEFRSPTTFLCDSPIVASTTREHNGKLSQYYFRPQDDGLSDALEKNLHKKYERIHHTAAANLNVAFKPDLNYLEKRAQLGKRVTRKITIKEGDKERTTDIIGFEIPFKLTGSPELMAVAYECGLGEKNSLGFGMIRIRSNVDQT